MNFSRKMKAGVAALAAIATLGAGGVVASTAFAGGGGGNQPGTGGNLAAVQFWQYAATGGVGAIEKYLVVDPLVVAGGGVRHINEPAPLEAPLHGGAANTVSFG